MRTAAFLVLPLLLSPVAARADEAESGDAFVDDNPYASEAPAGDEVETEEAVEAEGDSGAHPSRRETRIKDHAIGAGYYYTHMQWTDYETGATPQIDYHSLSVRYSYYVGQAQRFGFIINAATYIPLRADQSGVQSDPGLNGSYNLFKKYDRRVGFDVGLMAGTHRMLTHDLACIAGLGMHVGILKLNDQGLAINEYIAIGVASVFSLRYQLGGIWTAGLDVNASFDFRDTVHHQSPLDYALNMGLTAMIGMHF